MKHWEIDKEWSEKAMPIQDKVYRYLWPGLMGITRFRKGDVRHELDKYYHIDLQIALDNDIKILGQEKMLRQEKAHFDTFTIEFYQNRHTKEQGEFFLLAAQIYLHGYGNSSVTAGLTHFDKWYLIKCFDFLESLRGIPIEELEKTTKPSTGRASFFYIPYKDIPEEFIFAYFRRSGPEKHMPEPRF